eukprot:tig00020943_g16276.t1
MSASLGSLAAAAAGDLPWTFNAGAGGGRPRPATALGHRSLASSSPSESASLPSLHAEAAAIHAAQKKLARCESARQPLYESLAGLRTMRERLGTPPSCFPDAASIHLRHGGNSLTNRKWKEGAGALMVSLAHNSGDGCASAHFRGAVEHVFRDRPAALPCRYFEPGRKRNTLDFGPIQRREQSQEAPRPPEPPKITRTIIDDFPEIWRQI